MLTEGVGMDSCKGLGGEPWPPAAFGRGDHRSLFSVSGRSTDRLPAWPCQSLRCLG